MGPGPSAERRTSGNRTSCGSARNSRSHVRTLLEGVHRANRRHNRFRGRKPTTRRHETRQMGR